MPCLLCDRRQLGTRMVFRMSRWSTEHARASGLVFSTGLLLLGGACTNYSVQGQSACAGAVSEHALGDRTYLLRLPNVVCVMS